MYSGGLGVLAGDLLKEASDQALPLVGVGLFYRRGYFHQRVDRSGWQHEYWTDVDPEMLPAVRVSNSSGSPLTIQIPVWDGIVAAHVWRTDLGRVPLYLLDAEIAENTPLQRWVSGGCTKATAPSASRNTRSGSGRRPGARGHVDHSRALPPQRGPCRSRLAGCRVPDARSSEGPVDDLRDALERVRNHFVFTTHTPVQAGNETYSREEILPVLGSLADQLHFEREVLLELGRVHPSDQSEPSGLTQLAIHAARSTNAVSARHESVARECGTRCSRK